MTLAQDLRRAMTEVCLFRKENCHGGRMHAGEVLRVGSPDVAPGNGAGSQWGSAADGSSDRAESHLVRIGYRLSLEGCAPRDRLLWRNRTDEAANVGTCRNLEQAPSVAADDAESREATASGVG